MAGTPSGSGVAPCPRSAPFHVVRPFARRPGSGRSGSMHAKCATGGGKEASVTSAHFTNAAQECNAEVGLHLGSRSVAQLIETHFIPLIRDSRQPATLPERRRSICLPRRDPACIGHLTSRAAREPRGRDRPVHNVRRRVRRLEARRRRRRVEPTSGYPGLQIGRASWRERV